MKLTFALLALGSAAQDAAMLDDYVNMMMRQASSEEAHEETDLDEAIQAKGHGHGPHGHNPHGHWPHRHNPHSHWPHRHNPHRHTPYPTPYPTPFPTPYPTPYPTPHPCDDGSHGCDKGRGGICYKNGGNTWRCGCTNDHWCSRGCSQPHSYHTCTQITPSPTPVPTPAPTTAPTMIGVAEIDALKFCCEKEVATDASYILPLHTCADVRASTNKELEIAVHKMELKNGLTNDEVVDWLTKNRCFHEDHATHFPTPAPTPAPTAAPTSSCAVTCELDNGQFGSMDMYGYKDFGAHQAWCADTRANRKLGVWPKCQRVVAKHNINVINSGDSFTKHRCYHYHGKCVCECLDNGKFFQSGTIQGNKAGFGAHRGDAAFKGKNSYKDEFKNVQNDAMVGQTVTGASFVAQPMYWVSHNEIKALKSCCLKTGDSIFGKAFGCKQVFKASYATMKLRLESNPMYTNGFITDFLGAQGNGATCMKEQKYAVRTVDAKRTAAHFHNNGKAQGARDINHNDY